MLKSTLFINLPLTKMRIIRLLKNDTELRMVLAALMISLGIIPLALYDTYSQDVSQKISEAIVENLPEPDNGLAGR